LTVSTQGEAQSQHPRMISWAAGTSSHEKHAQELKVWRSRGNGCGDRRASRDPQPGCAAVPGLCSAGGHPTRSPGTPVHSSALRNKYLQAEKSEKNKLKNPIVYTSVLFK